MAGPNDIRAGKAFVEIYADRTQLQRGLKAVSADLRAFGAGISSLGKKFMVLGAGIVTPLLLASKRFMTFGSELQHMSERTGISTNALSEFGYAAELSGTNIEAVEMAIKRMQNAIGTATEGPLKRLQGLSPEEQFMAMADQLNAIEDPTMRAAKALQVFGRGGTAVIPMMKDLRALRAEAVASGRSLGPEAAADAEALDKAWERLGLQLKGIVVTVGASLAPMLTGIAVAVKDNLAAARKWISEHKPLIVTLFAAGTAAIAAGVGLVIFGKAVALAGILLGATLTIAKGAAFGFAALQHAVLLLGNPFILLGAAVLAVGGYLLYTTGAMKKAAAWIGQTVGELVSEVTSSFGVIADSMAVGDFASAAKVGWALVKMEWQKGVAFLTELWESFKGIYDEVITGIALGMVKAVTTIQTAWSEMVGFMHKRLIDLITSGPAKWFLTLGMSEQDKKLADIAFGMMGAGAGGIDAGTAKRNKAIEDAAKAQMGILGGGLAGRGAERDARIKAAQGEVDAARAEWEAAKQDAAAKAAAKRAELEGKVPGAGGIDLGAAKGSARGTFSASAVAGLAQGVQERIAKAVERTNAQDKRLFALLDRKLDFAAAP